MKKNNKLILFNLLLLIGLFVFSNNLFAQKVDDQWSGFRGKNAIGYLDNANIPVEWNIDSGKNIKWKTPIPGLGFSCPVIWEDYLFVTTAISGQEEDELKVGLYGSIGSVMDSTIHEFKVFCINKNTGKILWEKLSHKGIPRVKRHPKSSHANPTVSTDGKCVVAFFGSEGLYCYDFEGNLIWEKDFGVLNSNFYMVPSAEWGFASSPIIHKNRVIVQCDVHENSFLASFDVKTGEEIWRKSREEVPTWSTPTIYSKGDITHIIVNGWKHIGAYNFDNGEEIWKINGGGDIPVPTPVIAHDLIYINNAHGKLSPIYVIRPDARGDISLEEGKTTNSSIVWSIKRGGAYMQTPLVYGDYLYNIRGNGMITCYDALTGEVIYEENIRPGTGISASGIASDGKIYISSEKGDVFVVQAGPEYKLLAKNAMGEIIMATPAISKGTLFIRTQFYVYAIGRN